MRPITQLTKNFTQAELEEMGLPWGPEEVQQLVSTHRWYDRVRVVFEHEGEMWAVDWLRPKTEMQEGQDEWDSDPVIAYRVEPKFVTAEVWEPVT